MTASFENFPADISALQAFLTAKPADKPLRMIISFKPKADANDEELKAFYLGLQNHIKSRMTVYGGTFISGYGGHKRMTISGPPRMYTSLLSLTKLHPHLQRISEHQGMSLGI